MLQAMRVRLAAMAMTASGRVGAPDTMNMVIMVRSPMMHSVATAVAAARARRGPVSGSQRIRRPVVARVPPAVAIAMMSSGRTGMAARSAIRPVRHGLGWSSSSHQILYVVERHRLYRTTHGDPGVVNNGVEPFGQQLVQPGHVRLDRDVQLDWDYPLALGSKSASGLRIAYAGEDVPASGSQMQRNGPANPASGTSDED